MEQLETKNENLENKNEVEIEDILYRIEEMQEGIDFSITNITKIISQQKRLIDMISTAIHDDDEEERKPYEEFCNSTEEEIKNLEDQKSKLIFKKSLIEEVIKRCREDSEQSKTISILSEAIGLFKN